MLTSFKLTLLLVFLTALLIHSLKNIAHEYAAKELLSKQMSVEKPRVLINQSSGLLDELNVGLLYAAAAYCHKPNLKKWNCKDRCVGDVIVDTIFHDRIKGACGYVGIRQEVKEIIVAFRGSLDLMNWVYNLQFASLDYEYPDADGALVHGGFYATYKTVSDMLLWKINHLMAMEDSKYAGYNLIISGHSLGGALATLLAVDVKRNILNPILDNKASGQPFKMKVITFGQPRVGNDIFAYILKQEFYVKTGGLNHTVARLVHKNDLVAHLPPVNVGFMHNSHEIWVKNNKEAYDCEDFEGREVDCADCTLTYDMTVHLYIWDIHFGPFC
ncbi:4610_t:CDS:2 [Paraglomus occultum]|uniref:4610_t:CDS:1 n=1 Tax=Paraglomus occultum TaxID=144539 RepID=A0A9N8W4U4_9GLOM|nr:4610_t:CDS:2 [Paraglomus occultum]